MIDSKQLWHAWTVVASHARSTTDRTSRLLVAAAGVACLIGFASPCFADGNDTRFRVWLPTMEGRDDPPVISIAHELYHRRARSQPGIVVRFAMWEDGTALWAPADIMEQDEEALEEVEYRVGTVGEERATELIESVQESDGLRHLNEAGKGFPRVHLEFTAFALCLGDEGAVHRSRQMFLALSNSEHGWTGGGQEELNGRTHEEFVAEQPEWYRERIRAWHELIELTDEAIAAAKESDVEKGVKIGDDYFVCPPGKPYRP